MKTFLVLLVLHLENRIPITRDDTPWRSIAMTLLWRSSRAYQGEANAVRVKQGRRAGTGMVMARHRQKTVTVKKDR